MGQSATNTPAQLLTRQIIDPLKGALKMSGSSILPQSPQSEKQNTIQLYKFAASRAIDALFVFRGFLHVWENQPVKVTRADFTQAAQTLAEAGLDTWLNDINDINHLERVVVGGEK